MYVIGEVESNWTWNSVYYADPITLGLWQFYGVEAAQHLHAMRGETPDDYAQLTANLRANVEAHTETDEWWNSYNWTQTDGNSWADIAKTSTANHALQQRQIAEKLTGDVATLQRWGMILDNGPEVVFMLCVYHQRPVSANSVLRSAGGTASLEKLRNTVLSDSVLRRYVNRYNTAYARCAAWNGTSAPPDYGQLVAVDTGGNSSTIATQPSQVSYIIQIGDNLVLFGEPGSPYANGLVFYAAAGQRWMPSRNANGVEIPNMNTDNGSATGTEAQLAVVALFRSWENRFQYSQGGGRLNPEVSGYGDCSSTVWKAYQKVAGIDVGTWTGEQRQKGRLIASGGPSTPFPLNLAQPADLLQVTHTNGVQHVEMYMGENVLMGHGSGPGPHYNQYSAVEYCTRQSEWQLRRYL